MDLERIREMGDRELSLALTRHFDDLQLYANGLAEDAVLEFQQTEAAILELVREAYLRLAGRGLRSDLPSSQFLEWILARLEEIRNSIIEETLWLLDEAAAAEAEAQGDFLAGLLKAMGGAVVIGLSAEGLADIARYGHYGASARERLLERLADGDVNRLFAQIEGAIRDGLPLEVALSRIEDELLATRRFVQVEVEAVVNGVANDTTLAFVEANGLGLRYSAVMDNRVCEECADLDGTEYAEDDPDIPCLPRHINCRCALMPIITGRKSVSPAPFREYAETLSPEEYAARFGEGAVVTGFTRPKEGVRLSADELRERDRRGFEMS